MLKLYNEDDIRAIADAIRQKNKSSNTYTIAEFAEAIVNLPEGSNEEPCTISDAMAIYTDLTDFYLDNDLKLGKAIDTSEVKRYNLDVSSFGDAQITILHKRADTNQWSTLFDGDIPESGKVSVYVGYPGPTVIFKNNHMVLPLEPGQIIDAKITGEWKPYRVISYDSQNYTAELLALYEVSDQPVAYRTIDEGSFTWNSWYDDSNLMLSIMVWKDQLLLDNIGSNKFKDILEDNLQLKQGNWSRNTEVYNASTHASYADYKSYETGRTIIDSIYPLTVKMIEDYFEYTFSTDDLKTFISNVGNSTTRDYWLMCSDKASASRPFPQDVYYISGRNGVIDSKWMSGSCYLKPVFNVNLKKFLYHFNTHNVTTNLTNVVADVQNKTIINNGTRKTILHYQAAVNYVLPKEITVSGARYSWDNITGTLTLFDVTSAVNITIVGQVPPAGYTVNISLTNAAVRVIDSNNVSSWIEESGVYNNIKSVNEVSYSSSGDTMFVINDPNGERLVTAVPYSFVADGCTVYAESVAPPAHCLSVDTMVTMADGTLKRLGDVRKGDELLSIDFNTMQLVARPVIYTGAEDAPDYDTWITPRYIKYVFSDGTELRQSMRHRMYNLEDKCYKHLYTWTKGEHGYSLAGNNPELISVQIINEPQHYARITLADSNNWFANGLSTGDSECPRNILLDHKLEQR